MTSTPPPKLTPMMKQYLDIKKEVSDDTLLLFRMGDFYEIFFEDAVRGAELMGINLTKRAGVAMAGIPYHALQTYLPKVLETGAKVAIAEQIEDPKQTKGIVKRAIVKVITPGTIVEDNVLAAGKSNFIVAVFPYKKSFGIACLDLSTGEFRITEMADQRTLETELHRLRPAETLIPCSFEEEFSSYKEALPTTMVISPVDDWNFDSDYAEDSLKRHFGVSTLDGFGCRGMTLAVAAAGAILAYVQNNLRRNAAHITSLTTYSQSGHMILDRISQRNLELVEPIFKDSKNSTLISVLDQTMTPMGSRLMREWILRPLIDVEKIEARLDAVESFYNDQLSLQEMRECLSAVKDVERIITRLNVGSANARDLMSLCSALDMLPDLKAVMDCLPETGLVQELRSQLHDFVPLCEHLKATIIAEPPLGIKDGGLINEGIDDTLDNLRKGAREGKDWLVRYEAEEKERTGIRGLKVRYNRVFGYYIELSTANVPLAPETYIRKQTLTNAERFITPELKEIENNILGADDKAKALEYEIFQNLREEVVTYTAAIQESSRALAGLDSLASLAYVALHRSYTRPQINTENRLDIKDGRHAVIDALMEDESFVPNDSSLNNVDSQLHIITGPNMAGKSTYIRQVALITIMAQMGGFVPCSQADVGIMRCVFTRIGAADDLSRGQSTFMVEMIETANILNNATPDSLVILDEIGRGTSTYDGLSLAWAIAEHLHECGALTLFATHYHELTTLAADSSRIRNYNVAVKEWDDRIIFLHKILAGGTDRSYGIYVARLAGLPEAVIKRSQEVLSILEGDRKGETLKEPVVTPPKSKIRSSRKKSLDVEDQPLLFDTF